MNEDERIIAEDAFNRRLSGVRKGRPTGEVKSTGGFKRKPAKLTVEEMLAGGRQQTEIPILKAEDAAQAQPRPPQPQQAQAPQAQAPQPPQPQAPQQFQQPQQQFPPQEQPQPAAPQQFQQPLAEQQPAPMPPSPFTELPADEHSQPADPNMEIDPNIKAQLHALAQTGTEQAKKKRKPLRGEQKKLSEEEMAILNRQKERLMDGQPELLGQPEPQPQALVSVGEVEASRQEQLERSMIFDEEIPQLFNYRHSINMLQREVKRANRHQRPVAVSVVAFHEFPQINSKIGGDALPLTLKLIGRILAHFVDLDMEVAGRLSEDRFLIVLPEHQAPNAAQLLDEVRRAFESNGVTFQQYKFLIKPSFGVSCLPVHGNDWNDLLNKAEIAAQQAIQRGGNTIAFAPRQ